LTRSRAFVFCIKKKRVGEKSEKVNKCQIEE